MSFDEYLKLSLQLDLNLVEKIIGEYRLESFVYNKGTKLTVIPHNYQSFLMGDGYKEIILEHDFKYYDLFKASQRIMSSSPAIMYEQFTPYIRSRGNVLLAGLGLGIIPHLLSMKRGVNKIIVVEISSEVIELCGFHDEKLEIINDDIYSFLRRKNLNEFDYLYIDSYPDECSSYNDIIIPLKKFLLEDYPVLAFDFWHEDQLKIEYILKNWKMS